MPCSRMYPTKALDDTSIEELKEAAYTCTGCRRCMLYCPFGIDTLNLDRILEEGRPTLSIPATPEAVDELVHKKKS